MSMALLGVVAVILVCRRHGMVDAGTPSPARYFAEQWVDHTAPDLRRTWTQRYYTDDRHVRGPGAPLLVVLGGEGAIEPTTGLLYPFVTQRLAAALGAYVLQPEHRFYGSSQPVGADEIARARAEGRPDPRERLLTYEQAVADAVRLIAHLRDARGCAPDRGSVAYCPVVTIGGSYPGFLSFLARRMHPHVVDMAYAASAPVKFYAQQVEAHAYYQHVAAVADRAVPGCASAVRSTLADVQTAFRRQPHHHNSSSSSSGPPSFTETGACFGSIPDYCANDTELFLEEIFMMVGYTFANWNMAYYPPSNRTRLHQACTLFQDPHRSALARLRAFLVDALGDDNDHDHDPTQPGCFDMRQQLPSGPNATISAGDWSGVGTGPSGESWDFQTCTLCVEAIGFGSSSDNDNDNSGMFPNRQWTLDWLTKHCQSRFGVTPQPYSLNQRWHIDDITATNVTHILFTNGLQDGWSVSGVLHNLSETVLALNFPHGAHHSDLSGPTDDDTDDIQQGRVQIQRILAGWLEELPGSQFQQQRRQRDEPPPLENVEVSEQS